MGGRGDTLAPGLPGALCKLHDGAVLRVSQRGSAEQYKCS